MSPYNDQQGGAFGGPRIVRPQANVYTVLLLIAFLFMAGALAVQVYRYMQLQAQQEPAAPKAGAAPTSLTVASADRPARPYWPTL